MNRSIQAEKRAGKFYFIILFNIWLIIYIFLIILEKKCKGKQFSSTIINITKKQKNNLRNKENTIEIIDLNSNSYDLHVEQ